MGSEISIKTCKTCCWNDTTANSNVCTNEEWVQKSLYDGDGKRIGCEGGHRRFPKTLAELIRFKAITPFIKNGITTDEIIDRTIDYIRKNIFCIIDIDELYRKNTCVLNTSIKSLKAEIQRTIKKDSDFLTEK